MSERLLNLDDSMPHQQAVATQNLSCSSLVTSNVRLRSNYAAGAGGAFYTTSAQGWHTFCPEQGRSFAFPAYMHRDEECDTQTVMLHATRLLHPALHVRLLHKLWFYLISGLQATTATSTS